MKWQFINGAPIEILWRSIKAGVIQELVLVEYYASLMTK